MSTSLTRAIRQDAHKLALATLRQQDPHRAEQAAARVANAFAASVANAKNTTAWSKVSQTSVAAAVATSIHTDLYPGGPMPTVYLVPQSGELQWRITHRGLAELCRRDGYEVRPVPVGRDDHLKVEAGLVIEHEQDPDNPPDSLADVRGVLVEVRHTSSGHVTRHWVAAKTIDKRRRVSRMKDSGPWKNWPVEMAQKTAILYLGSRGALPVSTSMQRAMEAEVIEVIREPADRPTPQALPLDDSTDDVIDPEVVDAEGGEQ